MFRVAYTIFLLFLLYYLRNRQIALRDAETSHTKNRRSADLLSRETLYKTKSRESADLLSKRALYRTKSRESADLLSNRALY